VPAATSSWRPPATRSRLQGGRIAEDWTSFDSLELLRGLGVWRSLLAAPRLVGALREARPTTGPIA
jgi:hypothetical protein